MDYSEMTCSAFVEELSSKKPVPGGGGACAMAAAIGTALGRMVGSLTVGKKKYAGVEPRMLELMEACTRLQRELMELVEEDARAFEPLSEAYRLPAGSDEEKAVKEAVMEEALRNASAVPVLLMEKCCEAIDMIGFFAENGSVMAVSDAGVAAALVKAAMEGASLNVYINTKAMKDREYAAMLNQRAAAILGDYAVRAGQIYIEVKERLEN